MEKIIRQGDLLIIKVDKIPDNLPKKTDKILLEGEASGHRHQLSSGTIYAENSTRDNNYLLGYFLLEEASALTHPEHKTIELEPGIYKFHQQREYDPQEEHKVID